MKIFLALFQSSGLFLDSYEAADIPMTAIITPFGLFEFLFFPFGLQNTAQTFQRMMDRIFGEPLFCFVYLDDILVFSNFLASPETWRSLPSLRLLLSIWATPVSSSSSASPQQACLRHLQFPYTCRPLHPSTVPQHG